MIAPPEGRVGSQARWAARAAARRGRAAEPAARAARAVRRAPCVRPGLRAVRPV